MRISLFWTSIAASLLAVPAFALAQPAPPIQPAAGTLAAPGFFVIHAIDVGTGLAIFVEGPDFNLLYDAGSNDDSARGASNRVIAYLRSIRPGLRTIDHLILSHPHKDHSELMPDILAAYQVRNLWNSGALNPICSYRALLENAAAEPGLAYHDALGGPGTYNATFAAQTCYGQSLPATTIAVPRGSQISNVAIALGTDAQMTILHGDGSNQASFNENSVVVRLDLGTRRILLPGDSEAGGRKSPTDPPSPRSVEGELLACCSAELRSDILIAGHHGSKTSSRTAFLDAIRATHYIVSAGPMKYGTVTLPDAEVIQEYMQRGRVWRTDLTDKTTCPTNPAKIGPDNDGKPGGCDNVRITIDFSGTIAVGYDQRGD